MLEEHRPIGVFDSGVGGLSVLRHVHALLPAENLLYVADSAFMPYGSRCSDEINERGHLLTRFFVEQGAKAVVVACNTATAAAIETLRHDFTIPIIGMEPAVKPAVEATRTGVIGVLATSGTLASEKFSKLVARFDRHAEVVFQPGEGLVEQVEAGELSSKTTGELLRGHLAPLLERGVDALVLGCTHYPFLTPLIREIVGDDVVILDTGSAIAAELQRQLEKLQVMATEGVSEDASENRAGTIRFFTSGDVECVRPMISKLWGSAVEVESLKL